jgi:hypothetical protein
MASAIQWLAGAALLAALFWLFRFAMGLRYAKVVRERERRALEARGRRLVAEVPAANGELGLFVEDAAGFALGDVALAKAELVGVRLLVNGRVVETRQQPGLRLPESVVTEREGRERWDVLASLSGDRSVVIPCGSLGEGVSREAAQRVFAALARALPGGES